MKLLGPMVAAAMMNPKIFSYQMKFQNDKGFNACEINKAKKKEQEAQAQIRGQLRRNVQNLFKRVAERFPLNGSNMWPSRWEYIQNKMVKPRVICAAVWYQDGESHPHQPRNVDSGIVVCGRRHHNCYTTVWQLFGKERFRDKDTGEIVQGIQGFVTSDDRFLDRKEAGQVAYECGQTPVKHDTLISEHIY